MSVGLSGLLLIMVIMTKMVICRLCLILGRGFMLMMMGAVIIVIATVIVIVILTAVSVWEEVAVLLLGAWSKLSCLCCFFL